MIELLMKRQGSALRPFDALTEEDLLTMPEGPFMVKIVRPRSLPFNRMYWSCLRSICQSGGFEHGEGTLHDITKMGAGCFKVIQMQGLTYRVPDSTAFDKMDQGDFNAFFRRAVAFWQSEGLARWIDPELFGKISEAA